MKATYIFALALVLGFTGCTKTHSNRVYILSPFYRDIVSGLTVRLKEALPKVEVHWETASSHDISNRLRGKGAQGEAVPDIVITSDREFLDSQQRLGRWASFTPAEYQSLGCATSGKPHFYPVRFAVKGIGYHPDMIAVKKLPDRWILVDKVDSPLSYPERLAQLEKREVPFAPVLVENILEARRRKVPLQIHFPKEGPVLIPTFIAVRNDSSEKVNSIQVAEVLLGKAAQTVLQQSRLHPARLEMDGPEGMIPLKEILNRTGCGEPDAPALSE